GCWHNLLGDLSFQNSCRKEARTFDSLLAFPVTKRYNPQPSIQHSSIQHSPGDNMARLQAKLVLLLAVFALAGPIPVFAQAKPLTVGPLTVVVPPGWSTQSTFGPMMLFSPDSTPMQYFKVTFEPAEQITQDVRERHSTIVGNLSSIVRQGSTPQNGVTGKFIWTRMELQLPTGQNETMIVYSAKAGTTYVAVGVETTSPNLL